MVVVDMEEAEEEDMAVDPVAAMVVDQEEDMAVVALEAMVVVALEDMVVAPVVEKEAAEEDMAEAEAVVIEDIR